MRSSANALILALIALAVLAYLALYSALGPQGSINLLRTSGFTHIREQSKSVAFLNCGRDDLALFAFSAVNPRGQQVIVHTCDGPFIGATMRSH